MKLISKNDSSTLFFYQDGNRFYLKDRDGKTIEEGDDGFFTDYIDRKYGSILTHIYEDEEEWLESLGEEDEQD